jgi:pyruvate dehydrogenase complex dehydrogenase (E1) component
LAARQGSHPVTLALSHQGRAAFVQGVTAVYAQLADPDLPDDVRDVYAKLPGTMARLALILHACHVVTGKANEAVDVLSVHGAVQLVRDFQGHAPRVDARLRSPRADQRAETARRWLQAHGGACTVRDLQRHRVAGLTRASQADKRLRDLVDLGQGELRERRLPSGRTQRVFVVHTHAES